MTPDGITAYNASMKKSKKIRVCVWLSPAAVATLDRLRREFGLPQSPAAEFVLRTFQRVTRPERVRMPGSRRVTLSIHRSTCARVRGFAGLHGVSRSQLVDAALIQFGMTAIIGPVVA